MTPFNKGHLIKKSTTIHDIDTSSEEEDLPPFIKVKYNGRKIKLYPEVSKRGLAFTAPDIDAFSYFWDTKFNAVKKKVKILVIQGRPAIMIITPLFAKAHHIRENLAAYSIQREWMLRKQRWIKSSTWLDLALKRTPSSEFLASPWETSAPKELSPLKVNVKPAANLDRCSRNVAPLIEREVAETIFFAIQKSSPMLHHCSRVIRHRGYHFRLYEVSGIDSEDKDLVNSVK